MFGKLGWAEILVIVVLVVILFGSAKIPGMMKNLADGINVFKKEIKNKPSDAAAPKVEKKSVAKKSVAKNPAKKSVKKSPVKKTGKK